MMSVMYVAQHINTDNNCIELHPHHPFLTLAPDYQVLQAKGGKFKMSRVTYSLLRISALHE
jgi:hypothetical protein